MTDIIDYIECITNIAYILELKEKQSEHINDIYLNHRDTWKSCDHSNCPECHGTGVKKCT